MPPKDSGDALTTEQIGLLRAWIDQGTNWPDNAAGGVDLAKAAKHWSFQPIVRPAIPEVANAKWVRNPIDVFILLKLENEKVTPSPEADRTTLILRVYLDLLGLPPSEEERQAFVNDRHADAYEQMVDRALESPHYGERWGRYWLDLARYFDKTAHVTTGFHRNTMLNLEGGADREEDRVKRTIDRTYTTGTVWLGLTVGCANCHSHKYDPISQAEYFQLYAFFNSLDEVDISLSPAETGDRAPDLTPRQQMATNEVDKSRAVDAKIASASKSKKKKLPLIERFDRWAKPPPERCGRIIP